MSRVFFGFLVFGILVSFAAQSPAFAGGACCAVKGGTPSTGAGQVETVDVTENPGHVEHFTNKEA